MNLRRAAMPLLLAVAACSGAERAPERPPLEGARIGGEFALTDQDGRRFTDRDLAGKYRIMYFGYTFCPDVCPVDVQKLAASLKWVEAERPALGARIVPVFVTVDPARDTSAVLKQFVSAFHPRMVGLTGSPQAIAAAAKAYGIYYARGAGTADGYLMDHSRQAYLMSPEGKPLALLPTSGTPEAIAAEIERWAGTGAGA